MTRLALCLLLLATGASASQATLVETFGSIDRGVNRVHDEERGVTCYVFYGGASSGISYIPDSQLNAPTCGRGTDWPCDSRAHDERQLSPHEQKPEPTPALAPGRWIDERYEL